MGSDLVHLWGGALRLAALCLVGGHTAGCAPKGPPPPAQAPDTSAVRGDTGTMRDTSLHGPQAHRLRHRHHHRDR